MIVPEAGGVVFKVEGDEPMVLLVRAKHHPHHWIFPKGHRAVNETAGEAALREVREEAGVDGLLVASLPPPFEFQSDEELVHVQYFLIEVHQERESPEKREKVWVRPEDAHRHLVFPEARQLLQRAVPYLRERAARQVRDDAFQEFLLAEYAHAAASLISNEEDGEKRVTFLITLAGAVGAVLAFVLGKDNGFEPASRPPLVLVTLLLLFLFGCLTMTRVVTRNAATDRYKRGLNRIRRYFVQSSTDPRLAYFAFNPYEAKPRRPWSWRSLGKGGWLPTVVFVDSLILGGLAAVLYGSTSWWTNSKVGALTFLVCWYALIQLANRQLATARHEDPDYP